MTVLRAWNLCRRSIIPAASLCGPVLSVWTYTPGSTDPSRASFDGAGYSGALLLGILGGLVVGYVIRTAGDVTLGTGSFRDRDSLP